MTFDAPPCPSMPFHALPCPSLPFHALPCPSIGLEHPKRPPKSQSPNPKAPKCHRPPSALKSVARVSAGAQDTHTLLQGGGGGGGGGGAAGKRQPRVYTGSQWAVLSYAFCRDLLTTREGLRWIAAFERRLVPDESILQVRSPHDLPRSPKCSHDIPRSPLSFHERP